MKHPCTDPGQRSALAAQTQCALTTVRVQTDGESGAEEAPALERYRVIKRDRMEVEHREAKVDHVWPRYRSCPVAFPALPTAAGWLTKDDAKVDLSTFVCRFNRITNCPPFSTPAWGRPRRAESSGRPAARLHDASKRSCVLTS